MPKTPPIVYVDTSEIREGALERLKGGFSELVDFVAANVPDALFYGVYLSDDGGRVTVVHAHRESSSLEHHLEVGGPAFRPFAELLVLSSIRIYGDVSERVVALAEEKARMLGCDDIALQRAHAGFDRSGPRPAAGARTGNAR